MTTQMFEPAAVLVPDPTETLRQLRQAAMDGVTDWSYFGHIAQKERGSLVLLNYTPKAAIERTWTLAECLCRGLIIDRGTGEVVARPFDKFFNWGEGGRTTGAKVSYVSEKMDGSLGILYRVDGGYAIATRGSFESDQAVWATRLIREMGDDGKLAEIPDGVTLLFEIVYPENRIVLDYGGWSGLVLLEARNRRDGMYYTQTAVDGWARRSGFRRPARFFFDTPEAMASACGSLLADQEGYVAWFEDGSTFKFKGDAYKALHKLIAGLTPKRVLEAVANGTVNEMLEVIPDEFLDEAKRWVAEIEMARMHAGIRVASALIAMPASSRADQAQFVIAHPAYSKVAPAVFAAMDGKDVDAVIYKRLMKDWVPGGGV